MGPVKGQGIRVQGFFWQEKFSDVEYTIYSSLMLGLFDSSTIGNEVRRISSGPKRSFILEKLQEPRTKEVSLNWTQAYKKDFIILFQLFSSKKKAMRAIKPHVIQILDVLPKIVSGNYPHLLKALEQLCGCTRETILKKVKN